MQLTTSDIEQLKGLLKKINEAVQFTEVRPGEVRKIGRAASRVDRHALNLTTNTWNKPKSNKK